MFINTSLFKNNIALESDDGRIITYSQLAVEALSIRRVLGKEKCCILLLADKSIDVISMYYCCLSNGYVPLVMDEKTDKSFLNSLMTQYKFRYVFCHKSKKHLFLGNEIYKIANDYVVLFTNEKTICINPELAVLMSTSGTTGSLKTVRLSYENLRTACEASAEFFETNETDIGMMMLPMAYCFGQVFILVHLIKGAKICACNYSVFEKGFWDFFDRSNITNIYFVPYTGSQLMRLGFFRKDYSYLRYICQGGGKSDFSVSNDFIKGPLSKHTRFYIIYGQTEAVMISALPWLYFQEKMESVGIGLPNINVTIKDGADTGEIIVKGRNICLGYAYTYEDLILGDVNRGILYTGDIGRFDADGCLYILGRESRFSKIAGLRISHDEIERIIEKMNPRLDVACVGDDKHIAVFFKGDEDKENIRHYLSAIIRIDKSFLLVYQLHELPLLINGKIDYHKLEETLINNDNPS